MIVGGGCGADVSAEDWKAEEAWEVVVCAAECWLEEDDEAGWLSDAMALATSAAMVWALKWWVAGKRWPAAAIDA